MRTNHDQILLPFAEREYIDVKRAAKILGVSIGTIYALYAARKIEIIDFRYHGRKRVRYQSIVDFCDELRIRYCIADRRPQLSNVIFRHRDEDLLPFPLVDTITTQQAGELLGYDSIQPVHAMCQEGRFDSYKLTQDASPWRISRSSFGRWMAKIHEESSRRPSPSISQPARSL